jgi:2-dehydro-3-deoxyphosphogluconate aldolase/(4S)-4-hydroxy-2-oxoglutarate aldolase
MDAATAEACVEAGAQFIVSPGFDLTTVLTCNNIGILVSPGALTPTEIVTAWRAGADVVKVFPCDAMGGPSYLKALKGPLPHIPLMPTGGTTLESIPGYLAAGAEAVGVSTNLVDVKLLTSGRRDELLARARAFAAAAADS